MSTTDSNAGTEAETSKARGTTPPEQAARRSSCPVAGALDLVGDKWTLLVIRDLLRGKRRYGELAASSERIPTNILAERLRRLEQSGLVERVRYSERPPRYEYLLTPRGEDLRPAIKSLADWGLQYVAGTRLPGDYPRDAAGSVPADTGEPAAGNTRAQSGASTPLR